jgi:hypothetical protein
LQKVARELIRSSGPLGSASVPERARLVPMPAMHIHSSYQSFCIHFYSQQVRMLLMNRSQWFGRNDEKGAILLMVRAIRDRLAAPP